MHMAFSMKVTPEIEELTNICLDNSKMDVSLYGQYDVKRGLRDINGVGVLAGLTQISNVVSSDIIDGVKTPCDGRLYYRGINVEKLTQGFLSENRMGFEEVAYLLLFGNLPNEEQLNHFKTILKQQQSLPKNFVRDVVMKAPTKDMMNTLSRSVLTLYAYDNHADDTSLPNVLRQCINLISVFPMLSVYGYQAYNHYIKGKSLYIHNPSKKLSTAENILLMLRPDQKYTPLEAKILDLALVLHMEHGGGNNSTFTTHVVSSSGTDTYSAIAAALGSLKGPKHGGANIKVVRMFDDMKSHVKDWTDEEEVSNYLRMQSLFEVLNTQRFEESRHGVFRSRIARAARQSVQPGDGGNAHDGAFRRLKIRQCELAAVDRTPEVDVHQPVQHPEVHVVENGAHRNTRIADQHVYAAELPHGGFDQLPALLGLRHVHPAVGRLPAPGADVARKKLQFLHVARSEHHFCALRGVYLRHRLADTRRCARNDDYLICQCLHIFFIHVLHLRPPFSRRSAASTSPAPPPP